MLTLDPSDLGQIRIMMQSAGAWYMKEDGETVDIAENEVLKAALSTYERMVNAGIALQVSGWDGRRSQVCRNDLPVFNLIPQLQKLPLPFLKGLSGFFLHRFSFSYRPPGNELLHIFQDNHPRADSVMQKPASL